MDFVKRAAFLIFHLVFIGHRCHVVRLIEAIVFIRIQTGAIYDITKPSLAIVFSSRHLHFLDFLARPIAFVEVLKPDALHLLNL